MAKVQISIDDGLLQRVDNYADANYLSRSGLLTIAVTDYLNQKEVLLAVKDVSLAVRKIADSGTLDHDTLEKLEDFERFAKLFGVK